MFTQQRNPDRNTQLLEFFKPTFPMKNDLNECCVHATEIVLLQQIEALPLDIFTFENPALTIKFKALLKILLHQHFTTSYKLYFEDATYSCNFEFTITTRLRDAILLQNREEFASQLKILKSFIYVRSRILDQYLTFDEMKCNNMLEELNKFFDENSESPEMLYQDILDVMFNYHDYLSFSYMRDRSKVLTCETLTSTLNNARHINIKRLCEQHGLASEINNLIDLNNLLIAYHEDYLKILTTTIQNLNRNLFPNLDLAMISKFYSRAFAELTSSPTLFHENYLKELYLEQLRKPELRAVILQFMIDTSLPMFNEYQGDEGLPNDVDLLRIGAWAARTAHSDNDKDLFSVHQILDAAYRELFSPIPTVLNANEPTQLFTDLTVLSEEDIKPLFSDAVPGIITREEILTVNRINHQASELEKSFADKDRNAALEVFHTQLADMRLPNCLSVSSIAALLEVSNKYINIHTNPKFDAKVGKTNTETWKKTLKDARTQGLNIIKKEVEAAKIRGTVSERSIEELEYFRNHSLFSQHRSNYKIFGAFGRTHAQVEIDSMLKTLKQLGR